MCVCVCILLLDNIFKFYQYYVQMKFHRLQFCNTKIIFKSKKTNLPIAVLVVINIK